MKEELIKVLNEALPDVDFSQGSLVTNREIDSIEMLTIVAAISDKFSIDIPFDEINPENFDSIDSIVRLIKRIKG